MVRVRPEALRARARFVAAAEQLPARRASLRHWRPWPTWTQGGAIERHEFVFVFMSCVNSAIERHEFVCHDLRQQRDRAP